MNNDKIKKKPFNSSIKEDESLEETKEQQEDEDWSKLSVPIGLSIVNHLRARRKSQKKLAEKLGYTPEYLTKILKGSENLTLEHIAKIEKELGIKLIKVLYKEEFIFPNMSVFQLIEAPTF
jgi:antitoxin component HigA of HigAB toxin-antitoxin module